MLDDVERFADVDTADALGDVEASADQWSQARELTVARQELADVDAVVCLGMGGSGIAGAAAAALASDRLALPVVAHAGYSLPSFVGPGSLVVALSYSGDTEETLSGVGAALERGARVLAITSGGLLADLAADRGCALVQVPGGGQPRHNLGWLAVPLLTALGLDGDLDEVESVQRELVAAHGRDVPVADNPPKQLGTRLADTGGVTVVWGTQGIAAVAAYRLKCQLNENAKLPAFSAELPELDHNEVVGWQEPASAAGGLIVMRDPAGEHPRVAARVAPTLRLVDRELAWHAEVDARGSSPLARLASLILWADLLSVYTAIALDRDPTPVANIDRLKRNLGQ